MLKRQNPLLKRIKLAYSFKHCPCCGSALSLPIPLTVELHEPELGFAGDYSFDYPGDLTCLWLLCDTCYENSQVSPSDGIHAEGDPR